jgi:hypothetical protein
MFSIFRNALDFPLRQLFRWRRRGLEMTAQAALKVVEELVD